MQRQVKVDQVTREGRVILEQTVQEYLEADKEEGVTSTGGKGRYRANLQLQVRIDRPELVSIGRAFAAMGDKLNVEHIVDTLNYYPTPASEGAIKRMFKLVFKGGVYSWERVALLFRCTAEVCEKALDRTDAIINMVTELFSARVAPWVVQSGGWGAARSYLRRRRLWMSTLTPVIGVCIIAFAAFASAGMAVVYY